MMYNGKRCAIIDMTPDDAKTITGNIEGEKSEEKQKRQKKGT